MRQAFSQQRKFAALNPGRLPWTDMNQAVGLLKIAFSFLDHLPGR
jgi:hypothetical protein